MPAIPEITEALDAEVAAGNTVGAVVMLADKGGVIHESAHGKRHADADQPMTVDSVFRLFSMTKAIASIVAMKLVEEGRLDLDRPVTEIVREFAKVQVLDGFDGDTPKLRAPATPCTVRHLMTHTSGLVYPVWNADQAKYMELFSLPPTLSGLRDSLFSHPMHFDPGTKWAYGMGTDWLGRIIEEVTGERIDAVLKSTLLDPLGMGATDVEIRDHMKDRLVSPHASTPDGFQQIEFDLPANPEFYGMGHALNGTAPDYLRFLRMVLGGGTLDGEQILKPETVAALSANAIGDLRVTCQTSADATLGCDIDLFPEIEKTYSLAFMRNEADVPGMRRAGSLSWAGVMNTHYWVDPTTGIAAVLMMQHLPFVDPKAMAVYEAFETAVYRSIS